MNTLTVCRQTYLTLLHASVHQDFEPAFKKIHNYHLHEKLKLKKLTTIIT